VKHLLCAGALAVASACGGGASSTGVAEPYPLPDDSEPGGPASRARPLIADEPSPARELTADEIEPIVNRWYVSMSSLRDVFAASGADCARLAENLELWVDENLAALTQLAADVELVPAIQWEDLVSARAETEPELLRPLQAGFLACSEHPDFQRVTARIDAVAY